MNLDYLERIIRRHGRVDIDIAFHPAPPHLHWPRPWPRKSVTVAVLADTKEQAAFGRGGDQVAVQHEAGPAEHLDLAHRSYPGKMTADSDAQALFSRHVQTPVCKAIQFVWPIQSAGESDPEHDRKTTDLVLYRHPPAD